VTDHGGVLDVRSEPGQGSTFDLYLPCVSGRAAEAVETLGPIPRGNGETILLVDDEQPLVALGEEMLAALGYEPVGFVSSRQALESFLSDPQRFDLVITDEVMPELTGTGLARRLHQLRPELPILLATGYSGPIRMEQARPMGIREILKKPFQSRELAESIARHLRSNG
jgi:DNA-binding NtrC family response regulator